MRWLALGLLAWALAAQATPQLRPEVDQLSPQELNATQDLLAQAVVRLPPAWASALQRPINVRWRSDLPGNVHGRARGNDLLLDRRLLEGWMRHASAGDDVPEVRAALAAVLHELAHFYERSTGHALSKDPRLLDLAGWQTSPLRLGFRKRRNTLRDRSPDSYELSAPREFVAVNLEYFLLDPAYACRRPALYRYFADHFDWYPLPTECAPDMVYLQPEATETEPVLLQLDPASVYAVDYLLAEANSQPMSRWGHSMLRLVVCAPGRPPGPDCRLDLQYHRVLSFRAFVDDVQISSWRGLTGSYPSRLFVLPLEQVIDEYTKVELRGLRSVPLRLSTDEIAALLERAAQLHWNYDGRYYFISNNCAVETLRLLHDGVPRLAAANLDSISPTGLLQRLERADVADASVFNDEAEALRLGYRFESSAAYYEEMFAVAKQTLALPQHDVQAWLELDPEARAVWLRRGDLRTSAALLLLEQAALRRQEHLARESLKRQLLGGDKRSDRGELAEPLEEFLALGGLLSHPAALLPAQGYGLPQFEERETLAMEAQIQSQRLREQGLDLLTQARDWLPERQRTTLRQTEMNLAMLGKHLRELHHREGGMQLH